MSTTTSDRSLGDLFAQLSRDTTTLLRQEVALAKTELSEKVSEITRNAVFVAVGGAVAYAGLFFVLAAIGLALGQVMNLWLAFLIVGLVVVIVGYVLVQKGLTTLKNASLAPEKTIETLKEDKQWVQEQVK